MRFIPLIWAGLWRKPIRTVLALLSLAVGFLLFGLLHGVDTAFDAALQRQRLDRLIVEPRYGDPPMPRSYVDRIERVPGVTGVVWTQFLIGRFGGPKDNMVVVATDADRFFHVRSEFRAAPEHLQALRSTRAGILVYEPIAKRHGWKVGDRITLKTPVLRQDGSDEWPFVIVGFISNPDDPGRVTFALGNYDYFDDTRASNRGTVGRFVLRVADPGRSVEVANAIDRLFENSSSPTRSMSENEVAQVELAGVGDVRLITRAIISAVFFAILFLTGNTLLQSTRERTVEIGSLKALGFSDWRVLVIVISEAFFVCGGAAVLGLAGSVATFPFVSRYLPRLSAYVGEAPFSWEVLISGLLFAALLAAVSAALPGWLATRLKIVDALAKR